MKLVLMQCLTLFCTVFSIDIGSPELRGYPYIENAVGVHNLTVSEKTPLSTETTTWYILLNKGKEDLTTIGNGCPDNSSICAITTIDLGNGEDPIIAEIFSVVDNDCLIGKQFFPNSTSYGVHMRWAKKGWGDLFAGIGLFMVCPYDVDFDNTESLELLHGGAGAGGFTHIAWRSEFFCNGTISDEELNTLYPFYRDPFYRKDDHWGVFSIVVLVVVVVLAGYLIAQAWLYTRKIRVFK